MLRMARRSATNMDVFPIFPWLELCSSCVGGVSIAGTAVGLRCITVSRCGKVISWGGKKVVCPAGMGAFGVVAFDAVTAASVNGVWSGCLGSVIFQ